MTNPSDFLYDLKIVSHHPAHPGPVSHAMSQSTGIPTAICRQYLNGEKIGDFFIRGVTFTFARSIRSIVGRAGGEVEMCVCPWSKALNKN